MQAKENKDQCKKRNQTREVKMPASRTAFTYKLQQNKKHKMSKMISLQTRKE